MNIPKYIIPLLVIAALVGGYFLRLAFTQPSTYKAFNTTITANQLDLTVQGVKCKGTADFFTSLFDSTNGIGTIETFAADHRALITYDPDIITSEQIKAIIEAPIDIGNGETVVIFECLSMKEM